jgi:hypothetical protein
MEATFVASWVVVEPPSVVAGARLWRCLLRIRRWETG